MVKALLSTGNIDLVLAALFHDIMKPYSGEMISTTNGDYWSNKDHDKQASELILTNDDIRYFIKNFGGNYKTISDICLHHMNCKHGVIKKAKQIPFIDVFLKLDDMLHRQEFPVSQRDIVLPDGKFKNKTIFFVGQSSIQQRFQQYEFTITCGNTPYTYAISDIPKMFFKSGRFSVLA